MAEAGAASVIVPISANPKAVALTRLCFVSRMRISFFARVIEVGATPCLLLRDNDILKSVLVVGVNLLWYVYKEIEVSGVYLVCSL